MSLTRREWLRAAPLATLPLFAGRTAARIQEPGGAGLIVRQQMPTNLETPLSGLVPWKTPNELFYVRSHFAVPKIDTQNFKLTVAGHVGNPLELSMKDLGALPAVTKPLLLECAGNGRVYLTPAASGLQWGSGAVGNAEWGGVPLGAILERAKVKPGAVDVVLVGGDSGAVSGAASSTGSFHFDRSVPLAKAQRDECRIATSMNGEALTPSHGAPLRAVIGGWYGMASVKWLSKIIITDRPYTGLWQTDHYAYQVRRNDLPELVPVTIIQAKAIITSLGLNDTVMAGKPTTISGKAWAGEHQVAKVEVSTDGGTTWGAAKLANDDKPFTWCDWSFTWNVPAAKGPAKLVVKCTDDKGNTQPATRDVDRRSYLINHLVPLDVLVR